MNQAITLLDEINPSGVSTEKIRTILERRDDPPQRIIPPSEIETQAKRSLRLYTHLLQEVSA